MPYECLPTGLSGFYVASSDLWDGFGMTVIVLLSAI